MLGVIITWILAFLVVPTALIILGLTEQDKHESGVIQITFAFLYPIFMIAIAYFTWGWNATISSQYTYDILFGLYWIGLFLVWTLNIIVVPAYNIIQAKKG